MSVGLVTAGPACFLTDREIQERANRAKDFAKESGKNCIATYRGDGYRPEDLHVVRPERASSSATGLATA